MSFNKINKCIQVSKNYFTISIHNQSKYNVQKNKTNKVITTTKHSKYKSCIALNKNKVVSIDQTHGSIPNRANSTFNLVLWYYHI